MSDFGIGFFFYVFYIDLRAICTELLITLFNKLQYYALAETVYDQNIFAAG
jgi:hypothetical protein